MHDQVDPPSPRLRVRLPAKALNVGFMNNTRTMPARKTQASAVPAMPIFVMFGVDSWKIRLKFAWLKKAPADLASFRGLKVFLFCLKVSNLHFDPFFILGFKNYNEVMISIIYFFRKTKK